MTVAEFKAFLAELARHYGESGDETMEAVLLELAKLFDESQNLKVVKFVEQIRRVRRLDAA